jgi:hypothetical protein
MANTVGLMLLAVVILYAIAWLKKDPRVFTRSIALMVLGLIVGAGVKYTVLKAATPEKATVATEISVPTHNDTTSLVLNVMPAVLDCASKEVTESDNSVAEVEGLPTVRQKCGYIDDS